ncbi:hypothetical protein T4D_13529 [Trichinella pseudospiralis]|uniref:Uncharacterized protein n=1 Tax=Trichinella pseudospiralis TaxID=6337 RepID=A0A0V1FEK1_TRIPS|nr:hypothetical protein T4D_13529 [Trichinella pseudospiralis]
MLKQKFQYTNSLANGEICAKLEFKVFVSDAGCFDKRPCLAHQLMTEISTSAHEAFLISLLRTFKNGHWVVILVSDQNQSTTVYELAEVKRVSWLVFFVLAHKGWDVGW